MRTTSRMGYIAYPITLAMFYLVAGSCNCITNGPSAFGHNSVNGPLQSTKPNEFLSLLIVEVLKYKVQYGVYPNSVSDLDQYLATQKSDLDLTNVESLKVLPTNDDAVIVSLYYRVGSNTSDLHLRVDNIRMLLNEAKNYSNP